MTKKTLKIGTSENKAHAVFGASGSKRWLECPGSIALSEGMPNIESAAAAEGTKGHACLEFIVNNRSNIKAAMKMASKTWNEEMIEHAVTSTEYIITRLEEDDTSVLYVEEKIDASKFTRDGEFGTSDIGIAQYKLRRLIVADYKYGAGVPVDVEDNPQAIYYALGMLLKLGSKNFDTVELIIIQPRAHHHSGKTIRTIVMSVKEVLAWGYKFKAGVKACLEEGAPLKSGDHCQFCPAAIKCPELKIKATKDAMIVFDDGVVKKVPSVKELSPAQLSKALTAIEKIETYIKAVKEHAFDQVKKGNKIPGWKLVEKRRTRRWKDDKKVLDVAMKVLGDKCLSERKLLSPAQLEKKFKKSKNVKAWVAKNTTDTTGGVTLAKSSDKRKEANHLEAVFTVVTGDEE